MCQTRLAKVKVKAEVVQLRVTMERLRVEVRVEVRAEVRAPPPKKKSAPAAAAVFAVSAPQDSRA